MTDAYDRARAEQIRRSEAMVEAQRFGPPIPLTTCARDSHEWNQGDTYLICERCAATIPVPEAEPGVQVVPVD